MGRSKGNLGRGVPAIVSNPPNKTLNPEWWKDEKNLMRLDSSYEEHRRNYEKKQQKKTRPK
jgi:hypothetical protein